MLASPGRDAAASTSPHPSGSATTAAGAGVVLLLLAWNPLGYAGIWTAKFAVLVLLVPVGVIFFAYSLCSPSPAKIAAGAFLGVGCLSSLLADQPLLSVFGLHGWGTGLLFNASLVGAWALGKRADPARVPSFLRVVTAGLVCTCVIAVLQSLFGASLPVVGVTGRAIGLAGSANHLGALSGALTWLGAWQLRDHRAWSAAVLLGTVASQASGSRAAVGVSFLAIALPGVQRSWRRTAVVAVLVGGGLLLGSAATAAGGSTSALERSSSALSASHGAGGLGVRRFVWEMGLTAIAERPLVGHGPGLFRTATSPHNRQEVARAETPDVLYVDAHNLIVEHAVTVGLVGVAALLSWLTFAVRESRGPLLVLALALLLANLVNPQSPSTTPIAFLLLGVAGASSAPRDAEPKRLFLAGAVLLGIAASAALVAADTQLESALNELRPDQAATADRLSPFWSTAPSVIAALHEARAESDGGLNAKRLALDWWGRALERDDRNPALWHAKARMLKDLGRPRESAFAFQRALALNPWSGIALSELALAAEAAGNDELAIRRWRQLAVVQPSPEVRAHLKQLEASASHR